MHPRLARSHFDATSHARPNLSPGQMDHPRRSRHKCMVEVRCPMSPHHAWDPVSFPEGHGSVATPSGETANNMNGIHWESQELVTWSHKIRQTPESHKPVGTDRSTSHGLLARRVVRLACAWGKGADTDMRLPAGLCIASQMAAAQPSAMRALSQTQAGGGNTPVVGCFRPHKAAGAAWAWGRATMLWQGVPVQHVEQHACGQPFRGLHAASPHKTLTPCLAERRHAERHSPSTSAIACRYARWCLNVSIAWRPMPERAALEHTRLKNRDGGAKQCAGCAKEHGHRPRLGTYISTTPPNGNSACRNMHTTGIPGSELQRTVTPRSDELSSCTP